MGEDWSNENSLKPPSNLIACRPMAALRLLFFSDFRCGVPLFIVNLVIYIYISISATFQVSRLSVC